LIFEVGADLCDLPDRSFEEPSYMSSKLSSLLVQDGVVSVKRMEEAFQRQVIYGGALGTVLLEMGALDEMVLIRYLSVTSSLTPADLSELDCSTIAAETKVFPQKLSEKYHVVPVRHEANLLHVIVTESADRRHLEELSFMLGVTLNAFVVPEVRLYEFMERVYGVKVPLRYGGLLKKLGPPPPLRPHGIPATVLTAGPLAAAEGDAREATASTGTLIGIGVSASLEGAEDQSGPFLAEAAPLGAKEETGREKAPSSGTLMGVGVAVERRPAPPAESAETEPVPADPDAGLDAAQTAAEEDAAAAEVEEKAVQPVPGDGPTAEDDADRMAPDTLVGIPTSTPVEEPAPAPHSLQEPARQITGEIEVRSGHAPDRAARTEPSVKVEVTELAPPSRMEPTPAQEPPPSAGVSPIEPAEAAAALAQATRRDQIFEIFLRSASSRCSYAALFVVFGDHAVGKMALSMGQAEVTAISQVEIPLNAVSLFRTVVETGSHYFGPVNDEGLMRLFRSPTTYPRPSRG
jgi:hypothetical protein